ncbi:pyridoxal phosphate (PLP)-dependent transferases superfamily protein [Actinidia rufa]|uniref:Pyridoxal phosphate (PLP)-dependent transferases superfamily protein n=1 Tax=Actinidia rufa TaxID=165716 RepID=A0A7J0FCS3_9ERIC|nr:pyridoxal phosphate (PLP)-dependent transferases superfamily protein [Actinidia rufa]
MARIQSPDHFALCLVFSLVLNFYFCTKLYFSGCNVNNYQLSWSQRAAEEAEAVASVECSGHGRAYLDGNFVDGKAVCECNSCFGGSDCSQFFPGCVADADGGDPLFLEPFWIHHAASSALVVAGWHRMSYVKIHNFWGRLNPTHKCCGLCSLSPDNSSSPARVVASIPYYPIYQIQTDFFNSVNFEFQGDASLWKANNSDSSTNVIEFVTSPNNPDGQLKKAVLQGSSSVKAIHDHAYYWPHFTAIPAPADEDIMIFTISKLTGHAGSRFGWAVVKDEAVYQRMVWYMTLSSMGVSRDAQLRALKLLKVVLKGDGRRIFDFAYNTMSKRWEKLSRAVSKSKRYSLQEIPSQYCNFFKKVRGPSPAYAWLKCEREEDEDCTAVLKAAKIIGRSGSKFSAGNRNVRLSLLKSQDDFELMLYRIYDLVHSEEDGSSKTM